MSYTVNYTHENEETGITLDMILSVSIDPGQRLIINAVPDRCQEGYPAYVEECNAEVVGYTLDTPDGTGIYTKANGMLTAEFAGKLAKGFEREMEIDRDLRQTVDEFCLESIGNNSGPDY